MSNVELDATIAQIQATETVLDSALVYVNSVPGLIKTAVDAALVNGATAAELAPLTALHADLKAKSDAVAAAIVANTPQA